MEDEDDWELCYPEYPNISCWFAPYTIKILVFDSALYSTSVLTVVLNLFIIISVSHFRQLHTPTNILLLSLAVSDCLVGLLLMPVQTIVMSRCWFLSDFVCSLYKFAVGCILTSSVEIVMLISIDRYLSICDPLHYSTVITVNRAKVFVYLIWFFSAAKSFSFFVLHFLYNTFSDMCLGSCESFNSFGAALTHLISDFLVPVTVIVVLYGRVFVVAVSQARAMRSHITAVTKQISVTKTAKKSELKAAKTLGVLVVVFLICLLTPQGLAFGGGNHLTISGIYFTQYLYLFSSFLNPVIYAFFFSWFRKAVKLIVTLQILQPGSSEAKIL